MRGALADPPGAVLVGVEDASNGVPHPEQKRLVS